MIMSWVDVLMARLVRQWSKGVGLSGRWLKVALFIWLSCFGFMFIALNFSRLVDEFFVLSGVAW